MNMIEALTIIDSSLDSKNYWWARPIAWKGHNRAFCCEKDGTIELVPSSRGGTPAKMPMLIDIQGDWEIVDPTEVNEGR